MGVNDLNNARYHYIVLTYPSSSVRSTMLTSIQQFINQPLDGTLVDNTPRLLEVLNKSERLSRLLNKRDDRGYTLLHIAAERNQPESLKCLLIKEGMYSLIKTENRGRVRPLPLPCTNVRYVSGRLHWRTF